jgi:hypothetical protein
MGRRATIAPTRHALRAGAVDMMLFPLLPWLRIREEEPRTSPYNNNNNRSLRSGQQFTPIFLLYRLRLQRSSTTLTKELPAR